MKEVQKKVTFLETICGEDNSKHSTLGGMKNVHFVQVTVSVHENLNSLHHLLKYGITFLSVQYTMSNFPSFNVNGKCF